MNRFPLLLACLLLFVKIDGAQGQVRFEPNIIQFDNYSCTIDTTFETLLINAGEQAETTTLYFKVSSNLTILEGPDGWVGGAPTTIKPHDTLRFVVRMQGRPVAATASMEFYGKTLEQFVIRANILSKPVYVTRTGTNFSNMLVGETRSETLTIHNPSEETRSVRAYFIVPIDGWEITGLPAYAQVLPGDSVHFVATFTATKPGTFDGSAGVRDECGGIDYYFKAIVLPAMDVKQRGKSEITLQQRGGYLEVSGCRVGASIILSDIAGRTYYSAESKAADLGIDLTNVPAGPYLLSVLDGPSTETYKLEIR